MRVDLGGGRARVAEDLLHRTQVRAALQEMRRGRMAQPMRAQIGQALDGIEPAVHHLTKEFRAAAKKADDPHGLHLWAGTGYRSAQDGSAETIVKDLGTRFARE